MKNLYKIFTTILLLFCVTLQAQQDYYWIGDGGSWEDLSHWATTSGGSVNHAAVPTANDNVIFDENSFKSRQSVWVNSNPEINNITVTEGLTEPFTIHTPYKKEIKINGDLNLTSKVTFDANIRLVGAGVINSGGAVFKSIDLESSGTYRLGSDFLGKKCSIELIKGKFDTAGFTFKAHNFTSYSNSNVIELYLRNSKVEVSLFDVNKVSNFDAGTSTIKAESVSLKGNQTFHNVELEGGRFGHFASEGRSVKAIVNKLTLHGGEIGLGKITVQDLVIGKSIDFAPGTEIEVQKSFSVLNTSNTCEEFKTISSKYFFDFKNGKPITLDIVAGATVSGLSNLIISDVHSVNPLTVSESIDAGNNDNIIFNNPSTSTNLYWIGGSGNWEDEQHWSTTSGGSSSGCIPNANTNVFFDTNSGFTTEGEQIVLTSLENSCKNITFSTGKAPILKQKEKVLTALQIYGSMELEQGMKYEIITEFKAWEANQNITTNGVRLGPIDKGSHKATFQGNGSWLLQDDFSVKILHLSKGSLHTNNHNLYVRAFTSAGALPKGLILGSSEIHVEQVNMPHSANFTLDAGTSHFIVHNTADNNNNFEGPGPTKPLYNISYINPNEDNFNYMSKVKANRVELKTSVALSNNEFNELILYKGSTYQMYTNKINTHLSAEGTDCEIVFLRGVNSSRLTFDDAATATINYAILEGINSSKPIEATNAIDFGNNENITFSGTPQGKDLYWRGGSGNWSDSSHWVDASGAPACVPKLTDNVFFDSNSFNAPGQKVVLDVEGYCNDVTWDGATDTPTFENKQTNIHLNVYGNITIQKQMHYKVYTHLKGENKRITSNGGFFGNTIIIYDSYELLDDIYVKGLYFSSAYFNSNGYNIKADRQIRTLNNGRDYIDISNSTIQTTLFSLSINNVDLITTGTKIIASDFRIKHGQEFEELLLLPNNRISNNGTSGNFIAKKVTFATDADVKSNFTTDELSISAGVDLTIDSGKTVNVNKHLNIYSNNCITTSIRGEGIANLNVVAGATPLEFDYVNISNINATGETLTFGSNSGGSGNTNINFTQGVSGTISPLGDDVVVCNQAMSSYTITSNSYFPSNASIKWYKDNTEIVGETEQSLTVTENGVYKITTIYGNGCSTTDEIRVDFVTSPTPTVTNTQKIQYFAASANATVADLQVDGVTAGAEVKWYDSTTSTTPLPKTTVLVNGGEYYATQQLNTCESDKSIKVLVSITDSSTAFVTTWQVEDSDTSIIIPVDEDNYTYNYSISWEEIGNPSHHGNFSGVTGDQIIDFGSAGNYRVEIGGDFPKIFLQSTQSANNNDKIQRVENWGIINWKSFEDSFSYCTNLDVVAEDVPDLSDVTSLHNMFIDCKNLIGNTKFNEWNTSHITNMQGVFSGAKLFNQPLNNWQTSQVIDMSNMFKEAYIFNQPLNNWNTSLVTNLEGTFNKAYNFNQDISSWNVSSVTNMTDLFLDSNLSSYNFSKIMRSWANQNFQLSSINTNWGDTGIRYAISAIDNATISNLQAKGLEIDAEPQIRRGAGVIYKEKNNHNTGYTLVGTKENGAFEWLTDYKTYDDIEGAPTQLLVFKRSGTSLDSDMVVKANSHRDNNSEHIYKLQNEVVGQQETRPANQVINMEQHTPGIIVYDPTNGHYYEATTAEWVRIDN